MRRSEGVWWVTAFFSTLIIPAVRSNQRDFEDGPDSMRVGVSVGRTPLAPRAFGCQVHRPHEAVSSSVGQGRYWSTSASRPSSWVSAVSGRGRSGKPTRIAQRPPCSQYDQCRAPLQLCPGNIWKSVVFRDSGCPSVGAEVQIEPRNSNSALLNASGCSSPAK